MFPTAQNREYWDSFPDRSYIKRAEAALDYAWPTVRATAFMEFLKSGERVSERVHGDKMKHLVDLVFAELIENRGRFLPQIVDGLCSICEETAWCSSAHWADEIPRNMHDVRDPYPDLIAGITAERLSMTVSLLREPLLTFCPEIVDRVKYELERRIKIPYMTHTDYWWMGYGDRAPNNWNPWIISNVLQTFLLTENDSERFYTALDKMLTELQHYYDALPDDGGCDEGPGYWAVAGACLFECLELLLRSSGGALDLFKDKKLSRIAAYLREVHVAGDIFVNLADAHYGHLAHTMPICFAFARAVGDSELMSFCAAVYAQRAKELNPYAEINMRRVFYAVENYPELSSYKYTLPIRKGAQYLPDLEIGGIRQGELLIFAKGGHNDESHNHNDVGSFMLYDGATPVLVDVGIGTYTRFTFSEHRYDMIPWVKADNHNIPAINGEVQRYGKGYRADSFTVEEDKIEISFASAYPQEAGLKELKRELSFGESGIVCTDSILCKEGAPCVCEVFMSVLPVRIEDNTAIIGERYRLRADVGCVGCEYVSFDDSSLERDWGVNGVSRITVDAVDAHRIEIRVDII